MADDTDTMRSRARRRLAPLFLALLAAYALPTFVARSAHADGPTEAEKAVARRKFADGEQAYAQKRYADAVELFLDADKVIADPAFAFNLAETYEALNDRPHALRWSREYLKRSPTASDRADMEARIARHEKALAQKGVQQITISTTPPGATLAVDGRALGTTPWTGELSPGTHILDISLTGYEAERRPFDLGAEHATDLPIELRSSAPEPGPVPLPVPGPAPQPVPHPGGDTTSRPPLLAVGAVGLGLGGASLAIALGLEIARGGSEQKARDAATQLEALDAANAMSDYQTGARVALGVGLGLVVVGGALIAADVATAGDESAGAVERPHWLASCGPLGCMASLGGPLP